MGTATWRCVDPWDRSCITQIGLQLNNILRERLGRPRVSPERAHSVLVGARGPAEPEVDAPRMQGSEGAELLRDHEWRVVREHDAARAEPDSLGVRGHVGDEHRGGRRCDRAHVVVLGVPDPAVPELLGTLGESDAALEAVSHTLTWPDDRKIKQ